MQTKQSHKRLTAFLLTLCMLLGTFPSPGGTAKAVNALTLTPVAEVVVNLHIYRYYNESASWSQAEEYCEQLGGHLVTITSVEEQFTVQSLLRQVASPRDYWIGLTDPNKNNGWQWVTGEPYSYQNWDSGEPNHYGGYEYWAQLYHGNGRWNDLPHEGDGRSMGFIYECEAPSVSYLDASGNSKSEFCVPVAANPTVWHTGWYVSNMDLTVADRITVNGNVNLILANGKTLTASSGIDVPSGSSLTIYGQTTDASSMGALVATAPGESRGKAGIGSTWETPVGSITINGGKVTATGGPGSTEGGGFYGGPGIGSARNGGSAVVTINGGIINAKGGYCTPGIGAVHYSDGATVTINGGTVTATGGVGGPGIGSVACSQSSEFFQSENFEISNYRTWKS